MILIVDDSIERHPFLTKVLVKYFDAKEEQILHAFCYNDALDILEKYKNEIKHIYLDHDFEQTCTCHIDKNTCPSHNFKNSKTGEDVAKKMIEMKLNIPTVVISINPVGAYKIWKTLNDYNFNVIKTPFSYIFDYYKDKIKGGD